MDELNNIFEPCCTLDITGREEEELISVFKALSNPIRFDIIKFLLTHPGCTTGDIVDYLPIAQATTSQHLKVLENSKLIISRANGTKSSYTLDNSTIKWVKKKIDLIF